MEVQKEGEVRVCVARANFSQRSRRGEQGERRQEEEKVQDETEETQTWLFNSQILTNIFMKPALFLFLFWNSIAFLSLLYFISPFLTSLQPRTSMRTAISKFKTKHF